MLLQVLRRSGGSPAQGRTGAAHAGARLPEIPEEASALISVFRQYRGCDELVPTLAIDAHSFATAPIGESIRINVDALSILPLSLNLLLHFLGTLKPFFPSAGHLVGVCEESQEGRIIFLPKPRNANCSDGERGNVDHDPIIPHEHAVANSHRN